MDDGAAATRRARPGAPAELIGAETAARTHKARPQAGSGIFRLVAGQRAWYRHFPRQRSVNLVVTNVPGPPVPLYLAGARLLELFPVVPVMGNLTLVVAVLSYAGQLNLTAVADHDGCPDLEMFAQGVRSALDDLARSALCACLLSRARAPARGQAQTLRSPNSGRLGGLAAADAAIGESGVRRATLFETWRASPRPAMPVRHLTVKSSTRLLPRRAGALDGHRRRKLGCTRAPASRRRVTTPGGSVRSRRRRPPTTPVVATSRNFASGATANGRASSDSATSTGGCST